MTRDADSGPFLEAIAATTRALEALGQPHMLIGGISVAAHGHIRPTSDIDATVWAPRPDHDAIETCLGAHDLVPRLDGWRRIADEHRMALFVHRPSTVELDLSLALLPFELETIERRDIRSLAGLDLPVPSLTDLLIFKAAAFREQDIADIRALLAARRVDVDEGRLVATVERIADGLGDTERVAALLELLKPSR